MATLFFIPIAVALVVGALLTLQGLRDGTWRPGLLLIAIGLAQVVIELAWIHNGCFESWDPCTENGLDTAFLLGWLISAIAAVCGSAYGVIRLLEWRESHSQS